MIPTDTPICERKLQRERRALHSALDLWEAAKEAPRLGEQWPTGRDEYIAHRVLARYGVPGTAQFKKKTAHL